MGWMKEAGMSRCSVEGSNYFTERCSGSEAGSYSRLIEFVNHPTPGLGVIKKKNICGGQGYIGKGGGERSEPGGDT